MQHEKGQATSRDEQLFLSVFKESPIGIALEDLEGRPLFANPALCSMLGFSEEEMRGKRCVEFSPPEDAEKDWVLFQQLRAGLIDHYHLDKRFFRRDGSLIWGRLSISLLKNVASPLVVAIVEDITKRKRAEEALRESEERLRMAAQAGRMYAFEWDAVTDVIARSGEPAQILGNDELAHESGRQVWTLVHPDDRERLKAAIVNLSPEKPDVQISHRMLLSDGSVIWVERYCRAHFDEQGRILRMVGMVANVTERKRAEEALSSVNRKLIEAQEQERTRIARELHDDIGQRLALLVNEILVLGKDLPDSTVTTRNRIREYVKDLQEIAADIQAISHQLHSSKLQYLGIVAAARSFCREFSGRHKVKVDFTDANTPPTVPEDISLCLFRVLQEALQNALKHSGVGHFEVELRGTPDGIHLTVRDEGVGFDPETARNEQGLGLVSMHERVEFVGGTFSIESRSDGGTTIYARVPPSREGYSTTAAG
jgi:PAS domain S-box-containing protein